MGRALALLALLLLACGDSDTGPATGERAARLDPLPYRPEIEAVEAALYATPPAPAGDAQQVSAALAALLASIEQREGIPGALHPARTLWAFSESVAVAPDPAAAPRDHALVQGEWEAARDRAFEPTEWFTTASIEYVESIAAQRRRLDRASVIRLTALLGRLEALADAGERECETLSAPVPAAAAPTAGGDDDLARWQDFQRSWVERVDATTRQLPTAKRAAPRDFVLALERARDALRALRDAPTGAGRSPTPVPGQWQPRFAAVRSQIDRAREHLARLP